MTTTTYELHLNPDLFPDPQYQPLVRFAAAGLDVRTRFERALDDRHAQLCVTISNLLGMAERALERGDLEAGRDLFAEAQPYMRSRDAIEALWKGSA